MMHSINAIAWLGIRCTLPVEWEIASHAIKTHAGKLMIVDRFEQRMQISWQQALKKPDVNRLFDDFKSRDLKDYPACQLSPFFKIKGWQVYRRTVDGSVLTRAGVYDSINKRWIDVALPWPHGLSESDEENIISSFSFCDMLKGNQVWQAFNVHFETPDGFRISTTDIKPGDISLTFVCGEATATLRKIGMADVWFTGNVTVFLDKEAKEIRNKKIEPAQLKHPGALLFGNEKMFKSRWLLGKRYCRQDAAWFCKESNAVFQISIWAPKSECVTPEDFNMHCCTTPGRLTFLRNKQMPQTEHA